jgi:hypothetical protein
VQRKHAGPTKERRRSRNSRRCWRWLPIRNHQNPSC